MANPIPTTCAHCAQPILPTRGGGWTTSYQWHDAIYCPGTIRFHAPARIEAQR